MCIKNIYHNVYADGEKEIIERVETCRSGHVCSAPTVREFDRKMNYTRLQLSGSPGRMDPLSSSVKERQPTPYYFEQQPTQRSGDADRARRREQRASQPRVYVDGDIVTDYGLRRSNSRADPIPIPKARRSSTMPIDDGYYSESKRESRSRPIVVENTNRPRRSSSSTRRESTPVPLGPYDVLYNYGSGSSRREQERRTRDSLLEPSRPHRRNSRSPVEVNPQDGSYDRERRPLRRAKPTIVDGPAPNTIPTDSIYGTSPYGGSYPSSFGSHRSDDFRTRSTVNNQPPPKPAVPKGVRWEDDARAAQNAKISSRPKLGRSATVTGANTSSHPHGEVKGILKNSNTAATSAAKTAEAGSPPAVQPLRHDELEDLYSSVRDLGVDDRETSAQRQARREREGREERELQGRLRDRFSGRGRRASFDVQPGRYENASRNGRRTEVLYPDEGRYKYI